MPVTDKPGAEKTGDDKHRYLTDLVAAGDPRAGRARQVEVTLDGRHHNAYQTVRQALNAVSKTGEHEEAEDVVERLQPGRVTVAAAIAYVRIFLPRL